MIGNVNTTHIYNQIALAPTGGVVGDGQRQLDRLFAHGRLQMHCD